MSSLSSVFGSYVAIVPKEEMKETESGLIIQNVMKEKTDEGTIMFIGPECMSAKVGQRVIFKKYAPDEVVINNQSYLFILESELLGVLE